MPITVDSKQIKSFKSQNDFRKWMEKNAGESDGIWLKLFRKNSGVTSINYQEALDVALCFGWIDGQVKKLDDINSWVQRFTPRRKRSIWSQRNVDNVNRLIKAGLMTSQGQKQIDEAKADGRWETAYGSSVNFEMPKDFLKELETNKVAKAYFEKLPKTKKFSIYWKLTTLKSELKKKEWIKKYINLLAEENL